MVKDTAAVMGDRCPDIFREACGIRDKFLQRPVLEGWVFIEGIVEIVDVGLQMPAVMQKHCLFVDIGFHCAVWIGQWGVDKFVMFVHRHIPFFIIYVYASYCMIM